jgi:hypothetical protein
MRPLRSAACPVALRASPLTADVEESHIFGRLEQLGGNFCLPLFEVAERHLDDLAHHFGLD